MSIFVIAALNFAILPPARNTCLTLPFSVGREEDVEWNLMRRLVNDEFIEIDAFWMFQAIMDELHSLYVVPSSKPGASENDDNPVLALAGRIQYDRLATADPKLYQHLKNLEIEPQLYCLRWCRLIFGREFHVQDTYLVWDLIFWESFKKAQDVVPHFGSDFLHHGGVSLKPTSMMTSIEHIGVSMILYVRDTLLEKDQMGCMKRLLKYPPVEDISILLER